MGGYRVFNDLYEEYLSTASGSVLRIVPSLADLKSLESFYRSLLDDGFVFIKLTPDYEASELALSGVVVIDNSTTDITHICEFYNYLNTKGVWLAPLRHLDPISTSYILLNSAEDI